MINFASVPVNYLAVLVVAIVNMVIGYLYFGPLFGKKYMMLMGMSPEKIAEMKAQGMGKSMGKSYLIAFIGSLVTGCVLSTIVAYATGFSQQGGAWAGVKVGFMVWLGFAATVTMSSVLWERKSWDWWVLMNGYYLVSSAIMGAILASWM